MAKSIELKEAKRRLLLFNEKADKLRRNPFVEQVFRKDHGFTIHLREGSLSVERRGADEWSTDALALTLRFFFNERDGIALKQMEEIYRSLPLTEDESAMIHRAFDEHRACLHERIGVNFLGAELTRWTVLEVLLYGDLAHANDDKRPVFDAWRKAAPFDSLMKFYFEDAVAEVAYFIFELRRFNERILPRIDGLSSA